MTQVDDAHRLYYHMQEPLHRLMSAHYIIVQVGMEASKPYTIQKPEYEAYILHQGQACRMQADHRFGADHASDAAIATGQARDGSACSMTV